jgi:hypothetical protein
VVGARSAATQAGQARGLGNADAQPAGELSDRARHPDLTSGFRAARREYLLEFLHLLPNGFSTPTTTTLAFLARRVQRDVSIRSKARQREGHSEDPLESGRPEVLPDRVSA